MLNNDLIVIKCEMLMTTFLDEKWSQVILSLNERQWIVSDKIIYIKREENEITIKTPSGSNLNKIATTEFSNRKGKVNKVVIIDIFNFSIMNIISIIKDPDIMMLCINSKSNYYQLPGSYIFKFKNNQDFNNIIKQLEMYKNIEWIYRTKDQDLRFK